MMRSMYSAVSGLRVHQSKMDTIGNNIANINTVGFKKGQVTFQEVFSQVTRGASAPQGGKGGTNPQQVGMGTAMGSLSTVHTPGAEQRTDNPTDLMIGGEGFFVVTDAANLNNKRYTRAGNFSLDRDGNLVTADGMKVLGYNIDESGEPNTSEVTNVRINKSETKEPEATNSIIMEGNLNSNGDSHKADTIIRDSLGNSYKVTFKYEKGEEHNWNMSVDRVTDMATDNYVLAGDIGENIINDENNVSLQFNNNGKLQSIGNNNLENNEDAFEILLQLENISFNKDKDGNTIDEENPSGSFSNIKIFDSNNPESTNFITQYANETNLKPQAKTGNSSGVLESFTIDASGIVVGVFSNGERKPLSQIMVAKFDNPMGLQKMGGNMFLDTRNSGEAQLGQAGSSGYGAIEGGALEMSNVDISQEFTEMITTQRGFQANSRIITTSDEMLQELVNMKR